MGTRSTYWTCTAFADWLRGTMKPKAMTAGGWNTWRKQAKTEHPFRYWLAEEGLDKIQNIVYLPVDVLYAIKYYVNNRWVTKTHALTSHPKDIPRGEWRDVGNRFLPCLFNELVDFVELEQAWHHIAWDVEARKKYKAPWWSWGWFRWRTWRCPEAGMDYLNWASTLRHDDEWIGSDDPIYNQPTQQAKNAMEIKELYLWWKNVYPNRKDPMELSGWSAYCDRRRQRIKEEDPDAEMIAFFDENETEEEKAEGRRLVDLSHEIEKQQDQEDEEMMIRLIKIRNALWT